MDLLVFWQNVPSIHQAPLLKELGSIGYDIACITEDGIPEERKKQGWAFPDYGSSKLIISPEKKEWIKIVNEYNIKNSVHIFSGILSYNLPSYAFKNLNNDVLKGIFTEPWKNIGGEYARFIKYFFKHLKYGDDIGFYLATGKTAENQLQSIGTNDDKIYPFAYFVELPISKVEKLDVDRSDNKLQLLFVGQLIEHKGLDILLKALAKQSEEMWDLTIIGDGPEKKTYQRLATELGLENQITFSGYISNHKVFENIATSDFLILPSRYDGWGAVVNEALTVGTPCIVSDNCGSCDLIQTDLQGKIFKSDSIVDLSSTLKKIFKNNELTTSKKRKNLIEWASNNIMPSIGARYLSKIINFVKDSSIMAEKPLPPWRQKSKI